MAKKTYKPLLTESIPVSSATPKYRFIGFDGALCVAGAKALGVSEVDVDAGEVMPVVVEGIVFVEASAAITVGAAVAAAGTSTAAGKAATVASTAICNGYAMDAATAAGDIIRVKLV